MGSISSNVRIMMDKDLLVLYQSKKTVFTVNDIALIWNTSKEGFVTKKMYRYIKSGKMYSPRKGIYTKDLHYDKQELGGRIYTPSYISFETVLAQAGVIFQYYSQIFFASYLSRELEIENQKYVYRKLKDGLLTNPSGIIVKNNNFIATPERALLDVLYLNKEYYFDSVTNIDWKKVEAILPVYGGNKRMTLLVERLKHA